MSAKWFRMRRAAAIRLTLTSVCILWAIGIQDLNPARAGPDASSAVMGLAASSVSPVQYAVDEKNGTISWMSGEFQVAAPGNPVESAYRFLEGHRKAFQVQSPRSEFSVMMTRKEKLQPTDHVYLEQKVNGLPVWGHRLGFHFNSRGMLYAVNGKYCATPPAGKLTVKPLITAEQAKELALKNVRISSGKLPASVAPFSAADKNLAMTLNQQAPQTAELI